MTKEILRLVLAQVTIVVYMILGVAVLLRLCHGSPAPANLFATHVRDYGCLFLLVPAVWGVWAVCAASGTAGQRHSGIPWLLSGLVLLGILLVIAFCATVSAVWVLTRIVQVQMPPAPTPTPTPVIMRRLPPDS